MSFPFTIENKVRVVLDSLFAGLSFEHGGYKYVMSEDYDICIEAKQYENGEDYKDPSKGETVYLRADMTLKNFINIVKDFKDDEIFLMAANKTLQDINMERVRNREKGMVR